MAGKRKRPHVSVNMAMSLDGRISTRRREQITLGTRHDRLLMDKLRAEADAVIVGAGTVRHDGFPIRVRDDKLRRARLKKRPDAAPINVVLSGELDLPIDSAFFKANTERILFTTRKAPKARIERFKRVADVVVFPRVRISARDVLDVLSERGAQRVLVEGGGDTHYSFAKEHVVDEIYITLTPRLIGGIGAPTILDGKGFLTDEHIELKLVSCDRIRDELFLKYKVKY